MRKNSVLLTTIVFVLFGTLLFAADQPDLRQGRITPIVKAYQKSQASVVNIAGQRVVNQSPFGGFLFPNRDFFGPRFQRKVQMLGSGVVVHELGYVVTNAHVVEGLDKVQVSFSDNREFNAKVLKIETEKDLALLKIDSDEKFQAVELGRSDDLMIGETVIAIGNPYGYTSTLSTGVISATGRDIQVQDRLWLRSLIQTDAPINPGNSGGALLNIYGQLIGINTAVRAQAENIGFAIPVNLMVDNVRQMLEPEKLRRVTLGLHISQRTDDPNSKGVLVEAVKPKSPADKKGIRKGDILVKLDDAPIQNAIDFYVRLIGKDIDEPIEIDFLRGKKSKSTRLAMEYRPIPDGNELASEFFGFTARLLDETMAEQFGFEEAYPILIITQVVSDSPSGKAGIEPGDLLLSVQDNPVNSEKDFSLAMEKIHSGQKVTVTIMRFQSHQYFGQIQRQYVVTLTAREK